MPAAARDDPCAGLENVLFGKPARYLYQKVQILAVDQTPVAQAGEVSSTADGRGRRRPSRRTRGLLTFVLPAKAAQYIASLPPANIYLTLVSPGLRAEAAVGRSTARGPLPAEDPSVLTPYGPDGAGSER